MFGRITIWPVIADSCAYLGAGLSRESPSFLSYAAMAGSGPGTDVVDDIGSINLVTLRLQSFVCPDTFEVGEFVPKPFT